MERQHERNLEILTVIGEGEPLTQRALAERLGVALGLANLYLKRLATKGYIKVAGFNDRPAARKRLRYLLTPRGIAEKTRLTYAYMNRSVNLYRSARASLRQALTELEDRPGRRVAMYGTGEAAELAYLTLREFHLEPCGVFAPQAGGQFLGMPVREVRELAGEEVDAVIVATFDKPNVHIPGLLALGLPASRLLTLYPRRTNHNGSH